MVAASIVTFIEVMPLGDVEGAWAQRFMPLAELRANLSRHLSLLPTPYRSGGPARAIGRIEETGGRVGSITPMTHSFCESCNRVRIAVPAGCIFASVNEAAADLDKVLRESEDDAEVAEAIREAVALKPKGHAFGARKAAPGGGHAVD